MLVVLRLTIASNVTRVCDVTRLIKCTRIRSRKNCANERKKFWSNEREETRVRWPLLFLFLYSFYLCAYSEKKERERKIAK